jgi:uncharacterized integral membrane protein
MGHSGCKLCWCSLCSPGRRAERNCWSCKLTRVAFHTPADSTMTAAVAGLLLLLLLLLLQDPNKPTCA